MAEIEKILMERDNISRLEAQKQIKQCRQRLYDKAVPTGDYELLIDIIEEELGLEPDYMFDLL